MDELGFVPRSMVGAEVLFKVFSQPHPIHTANGNSGYCGLYREVSCVRSNPNE